MDTNGYDMQNNDSSFALFWAIADVVWRSAWGQNKEFEMFSMAILEIKITVFTCLLSKEGCDSFPKHLDLELAPIKTNEGVKKQ